MSFKLVEYYKRILVDEKPTFSPRERRVIPAMKVALVYANTYPIAMGNLGFQMLERFFNDEPGVVCERFILPDEQAAALYAKSNTPFLSLDSQTPLAEFDLICFSISFENDYLNIPQIFSLARIPLRSTNRTERHPICLVGGAGVSINCEPIADFFDLAFIGEGEDAIPEIVAAYLDGHSKDDRLDRLAKLEGMVRPAFLLPPDIVPATDPLRLAEAADGFPRTTLAQLRAYKRRTCRHFGDHPIESQRVSDRAEFGQMFLIEVQRGCGRGCKFCAEGFVYLPFRQVPFDRLKDQIARGLSFRPKIGLIGADLLVHPHFVDMCRFIHEKGGTFSPSSVRVDALSDEIIDLLVESRHQTLALAPEGGSEKLRFALNKKFTNAQIIDAARRLTKKGIPNIKLYIIVGLPDETEDDLRETLVLIEDVKRVMVEENKSRGTMGRLIVSINPFIPKPRTPYQGKPFAGVAYFKRAIRRLQSDISRLGGVKVNVESPLFSEVQVLLSNGNREVSHFIEAHHQSPSACRSILKEFIKERSPRLSTACG